MCQHWLLALPAIFTTLAIVVNGITKEQQGEHEASMERSNGVVPMQRSKIVPVDLLRVPEALYALIKQGREKQRKENSCGCLNPHIELAVRMGVTVARLRAVPG